MATTTFTTMIPKVTKKPGPPVPPRPQQSSIFKAQRDTLAASAAAATTSFTTSQRLMNKVGLEQPQILKKPLLTFNGSGKPTTTTSSSLSSSSTSITTSGGRTVIYKSPSLNLQKRQEEREKRNEASTQTPTTTAVTRTTSAAAKLTNGTQATKPPLKLRKAPDVPTIKPRIPTPDAKDAATIQNNNNNTNGNENSTSNNIVIVQSSQGVVTLNRHHSMGAATPQNKPHSLLKEPRLSLGRADFDRVGKIVVPQFEATTTQPLPKPRKIVKIPQATMHVDGTTAATSNLPLATNSLSVNLFKRSKTSIENFTSRSNITTVSTVGGHSSGGAGGYLSGKTVEIKNNLKNAAERLFSEIMVNQQKPYAIESNLATNTIITKHERAIQHRAENVNNKNNDNITSKDVVASTPPKDNCTRINITNMNKMENQHNAADDVKPRQTVSAFNSPEKKSAAFHEMLISELAAMRTRSISMENLQTKSTHELLQSTATSTINKIQKFETYKQFKTLEIQPITKQNNVNDLLDQDDDVDDLSDNHHNQRCHSHQQDDDIDADNIEDADGDLEDDLKKSLKVITARDSPRKRTPSGCSSDSSPYGTERSARIRTSDWIEVGDNGKQVTLTSCHISLEDSGLEDEERMDEMSSSGVGDSWDSVKEAEQQQLQQQQQQQQAKRCRNVKRIMSINDLPPLPKSLSGINKMLGSDSGLISDVDTELTKNSKNNDTKQLDNQKENNINLNINNNQINSINNNNNNSMCSTNNIGHIYTHKDASDKLCQTTATATLEAVTTQPLKEINGNETISEIPPAIPGSKLDTQIATLRKEMFGLRQLDLTLLSQLWALNDSIQEFRTMIQDPDQDDDDTYSTHSRSPSPYDSVSSDAEDENLTLKAANHMELQNGSVITQQPKLTKTYSTENDATNKTPVRMVNSMGEQKGQLLKPPLPKPLENKPVPRMRSAPPPPPTHRKSQIAPPRPT